MKDSNTKSNSVLMVGCGDVGSRAGKLLHEAGWLVHGVKRNVSTLPDIFTPHQADYTVAGSLDICRQIKPEFVVATCNPSDRSVAGYRSGFLGSAENIIDGMGDHRPKGIIFVSSTRVFAESNGGWVDESSPLVQDDERALAIIEAEQVLLNSTQSVSVVRFAGIYGNPRGRLLSRIAQGELCDPQPARWSNRIHRDDCAGFLVHLLNTMASGQSIEPVYIGADNRPTIRLDFERWLARELAVRGGEPELLAEVPAGMGKRCRNDLLRASGFRLRYPDFRSGYRAVIDSRHRVR